MGRALHLFRYSRVRPDARFLVAARSRPVERFVAAAAWWSEGGVARFQLACQPGVERTEVGAPLLEGLEAVARSVGMERLEHAELLGEDHDWTGTLAARGFERLRSERSFEVAYADAWARVIGLHERHRAEIPATWRTEPIRLHPPETVLEVIAPHRLMPPEEVCRHWREGWFDPELSCVLFDGGRAFGAFLLRRTGDLLYIEVQVVQEPNRRLRSLGDLCLLYHDAQRVSPGGVIQRIQFRSGQTEHRQTANLALRMGGRELCQRHVLGKELGT